MKSKTWLLFALTTTIFWGIWGAFIEIPEKAGFPATLGYSVWALTMIPCALVALAIIKWKPETDRKSIFLGSVIGLLGAGGQLILFEALRSGPAYIVFPFISLFPVVTIFLSIIFLKERGWYANGPVSSGTAASFSCPIKNPMGPQSAAMPGSLCRFWSS
jgi:uncharacterized membrane protein